MINELTAPLHMPNRNGRGRKAGNEKTHKGRDRNSTIQQTIKTDTPPHCASHTAARLLLP